MEARAYLWRPEAVVSSVGSPRVFALLNTVASTPGLVASPGSEVSVS